ncbi:MAG: hypothetical protein ACXADU_18115 [Promethearchaeota archaeon]|jgi:tetratricopeptide (TPR) repeat protein
MEKRIMIDETKLETERLVKRVKYLAGRVNLASNVGQWDKASNLIKRGEELIKKFNGHLPKELEGPHCWILLQKSGIALNRGYLTLALEIANEYLTFAENYNLKEHLAFANNQLGHYYWRSGDLNKALIYYDHAIMLIDEYDGEVSVGEKVIKLTIYSDAMRTALDKGDLKLARRYFDNLEEISKQHPKEAITTHLFKVIKGTFLMHSMRSRDRAEAEKLFIEVVEGEVITIFDMLIALIGLCQLLLVELRITGDLEVINEMKPYLEKLIDLSQETDSDLYLIEAYMIQAKLALLTFDIKTTQRVLIQGQRIAEKRGFVGVAAEISRLHEELKGKLDIWEQLKQRNAPLSERIELARLNEHMKGQFMKEIMKMERIAEKEVTVYRDLKTCLVCKGSVGGFNYICNNCNSLYCKECAEAVIEIENVCWVCESPIDYSKPIKYYESRKEKVSKDNTKL